MARHDVLLKSGGVPFSWAHTYQHAKVPCKEDTDTLGLSREEVTGGEI